MKRFSPRPNCRGFALLVTLLLLSLLTLAVFGLSMLVKANADLAFTRSGQARARENALLGLRMGLNELQCRAGADHAITGMAGIGGIAAGASASTRHWCGVWGANGSFEAWLTSGAQPSGVASLQVGVDAVEIVGSGSVGAASPNSEHVVAGKLPIVVTEVPGAAHLPSMIGKFAYWVGDEGIKVSAFAPGASVPPRLGTSPVTSGPARLSQALETYAARLPRLVSYEQLGVLPSPAAALVPGVIRDSFHHTTLTARTIDPNGQLTAGTINVNTSSSHVWRALLETYNAAPGTLTPFSSAKLGSAASAIASGIAATASGKSSNSPFLSTDALFASSLLSSAITGPGGISVAEFDSVMRPVLSVRSDTFRIRGYGETLNLFRSGTTEATAYCEAIVQRTPDPMPGIPGRRFQIIYFRWLLPSDI